MPVPNDRLLFWVAMILPFAAISAAFSQQAAMVAGLPAAAVAAVAILDLLRAVGRAKTVTVALPGVVRLMKDRKGAFPVCLTVASSRPGVEKKENGIEVVLSLGAPDEVRSENEELSVIVSERGMRTQVLWPCTATARGNYVIDRCCAWIPSPWGLWRIRRTEKCRCEVRVYPGLDAERRKHASLFLGRGGFGLHAQRRVGKGRDFEKLREYFPGDGFEDIHWKATAKRGRPITKEYQVERTQEIYVAIDTSRLSGRPVGVDRGAALECFINAALLVGVAAQKQGDLFGLMTFSDRVETFVPARGAGSHFRLCRERLYALEPRISPPDFDELFTFIRLKMRRRALLLLLTDLSDPVLAEDFMKKSELICRKHIVMVGMVRQDGIEPVFARADSDGLDSIYGKLGGHLAWRRLRELENELHVHGMRLVHVDSGELATELISRYMEVKARQLL